MARILRQLPFFTEPTLVTAGGDPVTVRPYQIVMWVSVTLPDQEDLSAAAARFPAILDTGHSHNFSIQRSHLSRWARIDPTLFPVLRPTRINGVPVPLVSAAVWIHPNRPGQRDSFTGGAPFRLQMPRGIAVYPPDTPGAPRLPLLGLRALVLNNLRLTMDGPGRWVALRTRWRLWPF